MKKIKMLLVFVLFSGFIFLGVSASTRAEPSCVDAPQPDGTTWRTCVGDDGRMYCESCSNGVCSRVSCQ